MNPFAAKLIVAYEDYAQELSKVVKKNTDALTRETAVDHIKEMNFPDILPADKIPLFYKDALAVANAPQSKAPSSQGSVGSSSGRRSSRTFDSQTGEYITRRTDDIPPDVARELKAAGWDTIKGTWVKKAPNVYEVTDGRLETKKTVGALDVLVWKGYSGSVAALTRDETNNTAFSTTMSSSSRVYLGSSCGYGIVIHKDATVYCPMAWTGFSSSMARYESYRYNSAGSIIQDLPKHHLYVLAADTNFEMSLDGKRLLAKNDKSVPIRGQFVIEVDGKAVLELPRAIGK